MISPRYVRLASGICCALFCISPALAQPSPPADTLLARSLAYHDPAGLFMDSTHQLSLREQRPGKPDRETTITFDGAGTTLALSQQRDGRLIEARVNQENCQATLDGATAIPDSLVTRYRLSCEGLSWVRDYYAFLFALPMKITAAGTVLAPAATETTFQGRPVYALRATFDPATGSDTWLLYLDKSTYALVGYRFFHDEAANDGEYIVLKGEASAAGIRLPRERHWYTNAGDRFLGADIIERYEVLH